MGLIASDKLTIVIGLGATGLSCARFLHKLGQNFALVDTRFDPPNLTQVKQEFPNVKIHLGPLEGAGLRLASELIVSPGVSIREPAILEAKRAGTKVRGDVELFVEHAKAPIAAITGSNGKSTVTTLLGQMAERSGIQVAVGGNLGTPAVDLLSDKVELYVLELSSFQLEGVERLNAQCVTVLNISEDHMDRYMNKMEYLQAKQRIFIGAKHVVVNDDEALSQPLINQSMRVWRYGLAQMDVNKFSQDAAREGRSLMYGFDALLPECELKIKGRHNISNALAALAMGKALALKMDAMLDALRHFDGLPHRCQWVRDVDGISYINDSKGTNPGATAAAIQSFGEGASGKIILIAGGDAKGTDMSVLREPLRRFGRHTVVFGQDGDVIRAAVEPLMSASSAPTLNKAVLRAKALAETGDVVLFSPACASFDMFKNYIQRGEQFIAEVGAL